MKIPNFIRQRAPRIISFLEAQCKDGESLFLSDVPSITKSNGRFVERYSVYVCRNSNGVGERYIAALDKIKTRKEGRIVGYQLIGSFSEPLL